MVLGSKMNPIWIVIMLGLLISYASFAADVEGRLKINNEGKFCVVEYAENTILTKLPPPCEFVKTKIGKIRSHTYHSARMTVFIVMGRPDDNSNCSTKSQWFVLGDKAFIPEHIRDIEVCAKSGGDEIAFRDAFHYIPGGNTILNGMAQGEYD